MTFYGMGSESWDTMILFMGFLFVSLVAVQFLPDKPKTAVLQLNDTKLLLTITLLLVNGALGIVAGWMLVTGNVSYYSYGSMQYDPMGAVLTFFGGANAFLAFLVVLQRALQPFEKAGSIFPGKNAPELRQPPKPFVPREPPRGW